MPHDAASPAAPAGLTPIDPLAEARLTEITDGHIVLSVDGTNYRLHLKPTAPIDPQRLGRRVRGVIHLKVWKVDRISAGGNYVEPVYGRPRRVQGAVQGLGPVSNSIVVSLFGTPLLAELPSRYAADSFRLLERVGMDIAEGATFDPK